MEKKSNSSKRYSQEFKDSMVKRMLPPQKESITKLSMETGVSKKSLRDWLKKAQGITESEVNKFKVVVETYTMNEAELSAYCRKNGFYPNEIKEWRKRYETGEISENTIELKKENAKNKEKVKKLEKELNRKEKALSETAALLVLSKKLETVWENVEDEEH